MIKAVIGGTGRPIVLPFLFLRPVPLPQPPPTKVCKEGKAERLSCCRLGPLLPPGMSGFQSAASVTCSCNPAYWLSTRFNCIEEARPVGRDPWEEEAALQAGPQAGKLPSCVEVRQTSCLSAGRPRPESREKVSRLRAARARPRVSAKVRARAKTRARARLRQDSV